MNTWCDAGSFIYRLTSSTDEMNSSLSPNAGGSWPGSRPRQMQQPIRPDRPIGLSVSETGSDGGFQMWSWITTYGRRWKSEGVFSSIKRIFGEGIQAMPREGMFQDPNECQRLQYADGNGGLSESATETGRRSTVDIMKHSTFLRDLGK